MDVSPQQIVKRVARLCDLVSKPELNGVCVTIDSYDESKGRFAVTTLLRPTEEGSQVTISVKRANINVSVEPAEIKARIHTEPLAPVLPLLTEFGRYLGQPVDHHQPDHLRPTSFYNGALIVGPRDDTTVVVFEDYNFSSDEKIDNGYAVMCSKGHFITFRRCRFYGPFYGVTVGCKEGMGAEVVDESLRTEAINPLFKGKKGAYSAGLLFCGKKAATVTVTDCIIADCVFGIKVEFHQVNVTITNTTITNCSHYGMVVGDGAMGSVVLNQCTFIRCALANASGAKCTVIVDGARQAPSTQPMGKCNCGRCNACCLRISRASKSAGLGAVHCAMCGITEPAEVKYKACSQCKNVCYCSRECQKAHWKEHKRECKPRGLAG